MQVIIYIAAHSERAARAALASLQDRYGSAIQVRAEPQTVKSDTMIECELTLADPDGETRPGRVVDLFP